MSFTVAFGNCYTYEENLSRGFSSEDKGLMSEAVRPPPSLTSSLHRAITLSPWHISSLKPFHSFWTKIPHATIQPIVNGPGALFTELVAGFLEIHNHRAFLRSLSLNLSKKAG